MACCILHNSFRETDTDSLEEEAELPKREKCPMKLMVIQLQLLSHKINGVRGKIIWHLKCLMIGEAVDNLDKEV